MIGGNIKAVIEKRQASVVNEIGERKTVWTTAFNLLGWLDLSNGSSKYTSYSAKIQESTHIFICDYLDISEVTSENTRLLIDNCVYDIMLIDDPMNLNQQLEIYLKFVGGQNG